MIKIAIRIDDITEDMDWKKFLMFKGLLDNYGIKPLIGVVPDNKDDMLKISNDSAPAMDYWEYIKILQEEGWVIAMHGVNHVYTTTKGGSFPLNNFSEFAGLPYEEQYELLSYGVDVFNEKGINSNIFMAPGHSYDTNTIKALKELGFSKITDGFGSFPYKYKDMVYYPISFMKSITLKKKNGFSCLVFHVNGMKEEDFVSFEKFLADGAKENSNYQIISYGGYLSSKVRDRGFLGQFTEYVEAKLKHILVNIG